MVDENINLENRPWGYFEVLKSDNNFKIKIITVNSKEKISLQYHNHREEYWFIISGTGIITIDDKILEVKENDFIVIPKKSVHRIEAKDKVTFVEIQKGDILEEKDIIRIEDKYERK